MDLEIKEMSNNLAALTGTMLTKHVELKQRVQSIETAMGAVNPDQVNALAERISKALNTGDLYKGKSVLIQLDTKTAITSSSTLVPSHRQPVATGARGVASHVRDLLTVVPITAGSVDYPYMDSSTNNAGPQAGGSPSVVENVSLGESAYNFALAQKLVRTVGHYVPVSKQVLDDGNAVALAAFVESEMRHGLAVAEDNQLINGDGTVGALDGLLNNATAFNRTQSPQDNARGTLGRALTQVELADFAPNGIVLNPVDWESIKLQLLNDGVYRRLFGLPVTLSNKIAQGTFLVGDFLAACVLFERQAPVFEISLEDSDNFQTNMVTLKLLERVALVVSHSLALVKGTL